MTPQDEQLLKEYYDIHFSDAIGMPKYELLDEKFKNDLFNTVGFGGYRLGNSFDQLKKEIKGDIRLMDVLVIGIVASPFIAWYLDYFFGIK